MASVTSKSPSKPVQALVIEFCEPCARQRKNSFSFVTADEITISYLLLQFKGKT